jgi:SAM-dependent methyltransferase
MNHLGYYEHYLALRRKKLPLDLPKDRSWTLKEYGALFVLDTILSHGAKRVLEVGPGFDVTFARLMQSLGIEYWCIDKSNNELGIGKDDERFGEVMRNRTEAGAHWVDGLLGNSNGLLADDMFDVVFSISVLEHLPDEVINSVVRDTKRVLRPGGCSAHSIDIYPTSTKAQQWHIACKANGLNVPLPYYDRWEFHGKYTTFIEKPEIRYFIYNTLQSHAPLADGIPYVSQFATVLHRAYKLQE